MINYIVYNSIGEILRTGMCSNKDFELQAGDGEFVLEGTADTRYQVVINGNVVSKSQSDIDSFNTKVTQDNLRYMRNNMLLQTDWTQIPDAPLTDAQKEQYKKYRKALRDLPLKYDTINNIHEVIFPRLEDFKEK